MSTQDTIEITTPHGHKVVIRNYTTRGDDKQAEAILHAGMKVAAAGEGSEPEVSVDVGAATAAQDKYVELLVQSIDGASDDIAARLDELHSEDYEAISQAVGEITKSPKGTSKP